ncbi:aspartate carbamoyltransferase catalytic subunit [Lysobacteraceae bacterium NML75-0749]|nr:aspartate carbamoyltransferase catalytic subunit [Xanthomonadaceae bacterium NML03-0222]PJK02935.1 aspartate carbamoyltransferase catalytic subunit [Xanthomonadaceae bacterium NML75-0749]PJK03383.1 aspartate carbamoyltransferase catalytic subunit [Xanthomonadaceae bacterium NML91-0268]
MPHHLLSMQALDFDALTAILDRAQALRHAGDCRSHLSGRAVCTLFFEPSTRTRLSFQRAAQRLGADILNFEAATSSATKGETALDTLKNIEAMGVSAFIIRAREDGLVAELAQSAAPGTALINAGDGRSQHPTQALLDMLTIREAKGRDFSALKVAIVGDILHSRVARSDLAALRTLGVQDIRVCGPANLLPADDTLAGCHVSHDLDEALSDADVVMTLRLQRERMEDGLIESLDGYHRDYGITAARMAGAARDAIVMHPGPLNRGVEISDEVADGSQSRILRQVENGVLVRMAVLERAFA